MHFFKQGWADIQSLYRGEVPRPIKYKEDTRPEYPGLVRHYFNQVGADIQSLRKGEIPRPIRYKK